MNYAETIQDRPGQPAYEVFGIKRRFQWCKVWPPRFKESSVQMHQKFYDHNKHCWRAFQGYQHRWPWTTLNPKIGVFSDFFRDLWLPHTFQEWTASKSLDIDEDNLQMKFSALNVDFNSASFGPLGSRSPPYERIKFGYPLESMRFLPLSI